MATTAAIRVLVVDANPVFRRGVRMRLDHADGVLAVGEIASAADAVPLARAERADVVLMDLRAPFTPTLAAIRSLTRPDGDPPPPAVRVVVLTMEDDLDVVLDAFDAGAAGYLLKTRDAGGLIDAIRATARGNAVLSTRVTGPVIRELSRHLRDEARAIEAAADVLAPAETAVVTQLCRGVTSTRAIAAALSLPVGTVRAHLDSAMRRTETPDHLQLAIWGMRHGLDHVLRAPRG